MHTHVMRNERRPRLGLQPIAMLSFAALLGGSLAACSDTGERQPIDNDNGGGDVRPKPKPGEYGAACDTAADCDDTECVLLGVDSDDAFCTVRCASDDDCPDDGVSSCLSISNQEGLVRICQPSDLCIDRDGDGFGSGPGCKGRDCDDNDPATYPGAPELCNGVDNNCNGLADDNALGVGVPCDTGLLGICADGWTVCSQSNIICAANVLPDVRRETCNGRDDDCDGLIDEGPDHPEDRNNNTVFGVGFPCGSPGDACFSGYQRCNSETGVLACDQENPAANVPDVCDGVDNNCNGLIDEDANDPEGLLGKACSAGISVCRGIGTYVCDPNDPLAPPVCTATERSENSKPETCNYADDNCDGVVDEGFVNEDGVYFTDEHCGQCNINCAAVFGDTQAKGIVATCRVSGRSASCGYVCAENRYDLDRAKENGCEFEPDLQAIYVATPLKGGSDSATCGWFETPCATITKGIERAQADSKLRVRVAEGSFPEHVRMVDGVSVLGGHSSLNWLRNTAVNVSTINGSAKDGPHAYTVYIPATTRDTAFSGFTIDAPDADAGGNSYGIFVSNGSNKLTIENNTILAGRGGAGKPGQAGASGASGANGEEGKGRKNNQSSCTLASTPLAGGAGASNNCGGTDVSGGAGASINQCPTNVAVEINTSEGLASAGKGASPGSPGDSPRHTTPSSTSAGIHACAGGDTDYPGSPTPGGNGGDGTSGTAGQASTNTLGSHVSGHWRGASGGSGGDGTSGSGGGGGGSSEGVQESDPVAFHYGPTGGGGGAGGCGATGGTGGSAGGGSFGIYIAAASGAPIVKDNVINRGAGGRGGQGGLAGVGGIGGTGGAGGLMSGATVRWTRCGQHAAQGGTGGNGGHGGAGAGGNGGVSIGIAIVGTTAPSTYASANTFPSTSGAGGVGGAGGGGIAGTGAPGRNGDNKPVHSF